MQRVSFVLPLNRFEESDHLATRAALRQALNISDGDIRGMIEDAKNHRQFVINFRVEPDVFAKFLIVRNDLGSRNLFAELKARIIDMDAPVQNRRIVDFTLPGEGAFRIHDDMPQEWLDRNNERRAQNVIRREHTMQHYRDRVRDLTGEVSRLQRELIEARKPRPVTPADLGTAVHQLIDAATAELAEKNKALEAMVRRLVAVLTHGLRVVKHLRRQAEFKGKEFSAHGQSSTFMRHGENAVTDAKSLLDSSED